MEGQQNRPPEPARAGTLACLIPVCSWCVHGPARCSNSAFTPDSLQPLSEGKDGEKAAQLMLEPKLLLKLRRSLPRFSGALSERGLKHVGLRGSGRAGT